MTPEQMQRIREVFDRALHVSQSERETFLSEECGGDEVLQGEVRSLLHHHDEVDDFMSTSALGVEIGSYWADNAGKPGGGHSLRDSSRIGKYEIRRLIASGGMGSVYEAVQEHPHRVVALKVMRQGIASRSAMRRFEYEAQILARLRHPGICHIYEVGVHQETGSGSSTAGAGLPYFAMEYIPNALPITEYVAQRKLPLRQRLELFLQVCDAAHHGHQKGIIHRDLKPGNILVDSAGQPKIIDFGVAKATDSDLAVTTLQTHVGQLIGTLQYMSPEQCEADPHDLDIRSDVYALGVVLYELLCDQPPYSLSKVPIYEATRVIREQIPTRPSMVVRHLRGDLETITLKALQKERDGRYQSAHELARDIKRYLHDEPIDARPPSMLYQMRKFAYRNRLALVAVAVVFSALIIATLVSLGFALEENRLAIQAVKEEQNAREQAEVARAVLKFLTDDLLNAADPASEQNRDITMREVLDRTAAMVGTQFKDQPLTQAAVQLAVGTIYRRLGLLSDAQVHLEAAVHYRQAVYGDVHLDTIEAKVELSSVYRDRGDIYAAAELLQESLTALRQGQFEAWNSECEILLRLALLWRYLGQTNEALEVCEQAEEIATAHFQNRAALRLRASESRAMILHDLGRSTEAEALLRVVHDQREAATIGDPGTRFTTKYRLGQLLADLGQYSEAEALADEAYQGRLELFKKPDHLRVLHAHVLQALIYAKTDRLEKAREIYEHAIQVMDASEEITANHTQLLTDFWELSDVYMAMGLAKEAEHALIQALGRASLSRSLSPRWNAFVTALCRLEYAEFLIQVARYKEADRELVDALGCFQVQYGPDNLYSKRARSLMRQLHETWPMDARSDEAREPGRDGQ